MWIPSNLKIFGFMLFPKLQRLLKKHRLRASTASQRPSVNRQGKSHQASAKQKATHKEERKYAVNVAVTFHLEVQRLITEAGRNNFAPSPLVEKGSRWVGRHVLIPARV